MYMKQEAQALDLKEYYQERWLKSLGLDSNWMPEVGISFGRTRAPTATMMGAMTTTTMCPKRVGKLRI